MKKPCNLCIERNCPEEGCKAWQDWFLHRWEDVHAAAWQMVDETWKRRRDYFTYELPHQRRCPCAGCPCESWCQRPCAGKRIWERRGYAKR